METGNTGAGIFFINTFERSEWQAWNLGSNMEVFDAELFVIKQVMQLTSKQISFQIENIWIFSDSQTAIKRIAKSRVGAGQVYIKDI